MKQLITLLIAPLLALSASAQEDFVFEEEQPEEVRRYSVEIIIFSYAEDVSVGSEVFVPDVVELEEPVLAGDEEIVFDDTSQPITPDETEEMQEPESRDLELVMLDEEQLTMIEILERLERLDAYQPLMHFGWTQATRPEEDTLPIKLGEFAAPPPGLNGDLTLYLSRYLHLVVNLALDEKRAVAEPDTTNDYYDERMLTDAWLETLDGPVRFRIEEDRIVRNGEIRYFDHPRFGVIAKVKRIEEELEVDGELLSRQP